MLEHTLQNPLLNINQLEEGEKRDASTKVFLTVFMIFLSLPRYSPFYFPVGTTDFKNFRVHAGVNTCESTTNWCRCHWGLWWERIQQQLCFWRSWEGNKDLTNVISQAFSDTDLRNQCIWEMVSQGNHSMLLFLVEYQKRNTSCWVYSCLSSLGSQILLQDICSKEA